MDQPDQPGNPGGGAANPANDPGNPPPDLWGQVLQNTATLAEVSTMILANNLSKAKAVQKPSPFKGEAGSDARQFLAAYTMWAMAQGTALNTVDRQGHAVTLRDMEWIRAALSYLQDDAAVWASPAMEEFANGGVPFDGQWQTFRNEFKARFETVDEAVDAKERLRVLWQDTSTVPEYAALFKELMARTGYSPADLRDRFYEHLHPRIKDELVRTARPIDTLGQLISVASDIDVRLRQRRAERERERKRSGTSTGASNVQVGPPGPSFTPFVSPEPISMDVDATRTREGFLRLMRGRCFGCGSSDHAKKDGRHDRDLCAHCKKTGHRELVCMDKYLKKPKGQKAAATADDDDSPIEGSGGESEGPSQATAAATISSSITLAQLKDQQKVLAEKIAALELDF
jgi:hypothetical protein